MWRRHFNVWVQWLLVAAQPYLSNTSCTDLLGNAQTAPSSSACVVCTGVPVHMHAVVILVKGVKLPAFQRACHNSHPHDHALHNVPATGRLQQSLQ